MKKIILALSLVFLGFTAKAQDISSIVRNMPDDLILKIDEGQKELLLDQVSDTAKVIVHNMLNGDVERLSFTKDYIKLKTSDIGSLQIKLLPLINHSYIVGVIRTVCGAACDSQIEFYTTDWQALNTKDIFPLLNKDSFIINDVDRNSQVFKNAYSALSMTPIQYSFSDIDGNITVQYDIQKYLAKDDYKLIESYLKKEPIVLIWDKTSYKQ